MFLDVRFENLGLIAFWHVYLPFLQHHATLQLEMSSSSPQARRRAQNRPRRPFAGPERDAAELVPGSCRAQNEQRNANRIYRRA